MTDKKNKKTTDKPAKASKQAKPVVKAVAKAPAKSPVKAVAAKAVAPKVASAKAPAAKPAAKAVAPKPTAAKAAATAKPPAPAIIRPAINEKVQLLVSLSKKNGFVTVQNINEVIPDSATDPELIENIMNILDNLDIKLLDEDEVETYRKKVEDSPMIRRPAALVLPWAR